MKTTKTTLIAQLDYELYHDDLRKAVKGARHAAFTNIEERIHYYLTAMDRWFIGMPDYMRHAKTGFLSEVVTTLNCTGAPTIVFCPPDGNRRWQVEQPTLRNADFITPTLPEALSKLPDYWRMRPKHRKGARRTTTEPVKAFRPLNDLLASLK